MLAPLKLNRPACPVKGPLGQARGALAQLHPVPLGLATQNHQRAGAQPPVSGIDVDLGAGEVALGVFPVPPHYRADFGFQPAARLPTEGSYLGAGYAVAAVVEGPVGDEFNFVLHILAEFMANFVFRMYAPTGSSTRLMSGLRKKVIPAAVAQHDPLAIEVNRITDENQPGGWLARLSAYRDLIMHYTPLAHATHRGCLVQKFLRTSGGVELPSIYFPIPPDPIAVKTKRSKSAPYATIEQWIQASVASSTGNHTAPDALEFCHDAVGKLAASALTIGRRSPIAPQRLELTEDDLRGPISVKYN